MEPLKGTDQTGAEPRDTYKIAYAIHFLLGAGNLLPWNTFITAIDYFGQLYPARNVERVFSVAYMGSSLIVLVLMLCLGSCCCCRLKGKQLMSFRLRMNLGFGMFLLSLMVAPAMDWGGCSGSKIGGRTSWAYSVMVVSVVICGFADGLIGGSLVGSAGKLPKQYMQAVFAGTASSGVLVSILRIITKASLPQTPQGLRLSSHLYFLSSTVILVACIVCCNLLPKLNVMQQHYITIRRDQLTDQRPRFWDVARKMRGPAVGVLVIYTVTLSIFPGFIGEDLKSKLHQGWYPILLITLYNVSDLIGKSLTGIYMLNSLRTAAWACIGRLLFFPLFAACLHGPRWLKTEVPVTLLTFMLGFTNGYLTSVVMILAPKSVPTSEAEVSAIVMAVFLGLGLACGSILGWFWVI